MGKAYKVWLEGPYICFGPGPPFLYYSLASTNVNQLPSKYSYVHVYRSILRDLNIGKNLSFFSPCSQFVQYGIMR